MYTYTSGCGLKYGFVAVPPVCYKPLSRALCYKPLSRASAQSTEVFNRLVAGRACRKASDSVTRLVAKRPLGPVARPIFFEPLPYMCLRMCMCIYLHLGEGIRGCYSGSRVQETRLISKANRSRQQGRRASALCPRPHALATPVGVAPCGQAVGSAGDDGGPQLQQLLKARHYLRGSGTEHRQKAQFWVNSSLQARVVEKLALWALWITHPPYKCLTYSGPDSSHLLGVDAVDVHDTPARTDALLPPHLILRSAKLLDELPQKTEGRRHLSGRLRVIFHDLWRHLVLAVGQL